MRATITKPPTQLIGVCARWRPVRRVIVSGVSWTFLNRIDQSIDSILDVHLVLDQEARLVAKLKTFLGC